MNKTLSVFLPFLVFFLLWDTSYARILQSDILSPPMPQDSLAPAVQDYTGYRLHLTRMSVIKKKKKCIKLKYTAINTGREALHLGKDKSQNQLLIDFDEDFADSELAAYETEIKQQILEEKLLLSPGQLALNRNMKLSLSKEKMQKEKNKEEDFTIKLGSSSSDNNYLDKNFCSDITFDTLYIVKKSKHFITLGYQISNYGKGPAAMFGLDSGEEDNVAIRAYLASSTKLTRGSITIGGSFIKKGFKNKQGILKPNESYKGKIKLELSKMTKFTPHIILDLDVYGALRECNERNNTKAILVGEKLNYGTNQ